MVGKRWSKLNCLFNFLSGDSCDRSDSVSASPGARLLPPLESTNGIGCSGSHASTLHAQWGAHGKSDVCLQSQHGPAGHLLWEQVNSQHASVSVTIYSATFAVVFTHNWCKLSSVPNMCCRHQHYVASLWNRNALRGWKNYWKIWSNFTCTPNKN